MLSSHTCEWNLTTDKTFPTGSPGRRWMTATRRRSDPVLTESRRLLTQRLSGAETERSTSSRWGSLCQMPLWWPAIDTITLNAFTGSTVNFVLFWCWIYLRHFQSSTLAMAFKKWQFTLHEYCQGILKRHFTVHEPC